MSVQKGDTFWANNVGDGVDEHLLIVISDPCKNPNQLVLVTLTTWEGYKDDSCILEPGHPFVKHLTCVKYNGFSTILPSVAKIELLLSQDKLRRRKPLRPEILQKILEGASDTEFLTKLQLRILDEQELID
ncbi:MAG: hypothetical protein KAR11_08740 [Phycisphaerae bacterium]|nr:hypothetical protein [Phycisphaerae bacterium]